MAVMVCVAVFAASAGLVGEAVGLATTAGAAVLGASTGLESAGMGAGTVISALASSFFSSFWLVQELIVVRFSKK